MRRCAAGRRRGCSGSPETWRLGASAEGAVELPKRRERDRDRDRTPSIARNLWIDLSGPGIDAAREREHVLDAVLLQQGGGAQAARPVVAVSNDDLARAGLHVVEGRRQLVERHQHAALDARELVLPGLAHVEEVRLLSLLHPRRQLGGGGLARPGETLSRSS